MAEQDNTNACCDVTDVGTSCCKVEALISVDDRGQMILPKEIRRKANIQAGDKLAVSIWGSEDKVSCIVLTKADDLSDMVKSMLGPVMKDIL
ncbi:HgcAB-associated protein HgcC [Chloroflexota bacterium]